jgi:NAD dependent epimerase/dehydratase family
MRVFVTGATGAIGSALVSQLVERGHDVAATARSPDKTSVVEAMGATFVVLDVLDGVAVGEAVARVQPEVIVHQATALSGTPDLRRFDRWFATTNQLRTEGTDHLPPPERRASGGSWPRATPGGRRRRRGHGDRGGTRGPRDLQRRRRRTRSCVGVVAAARRGGRCGVAAADPALGWPARRRRCPGEVDDGGSRLIKREDQAIAGVAAALGQLARRLPRRPQRRRSTGMRIDVPHSRSTPRLTENAIGHRSASRGHTRSDRVCVVGPVGIEPTT